MFFWPCLDCISKFVVSSHKHKIVLAIPLAQAPRTFVATAHSRRGFMSASSGSTKNGRNNVAQACVSVNMFWICEEMPLWVAACAMSYLRTGHRVNWWLYDGSHGAQKRHEKGSHVIKKWRFWEVVQFPRFFVLVSLSKMDFRRMPFNQKPVVFGKSTRAHLEVQWSFGDEGPFQECQKPWILNIPLFGETGNCRRGVYFDAESLSAQFCRVKTSWIAICDKKNVRKSGFQFFSHICHLYVPYRSPICRTWELVTELIGGCTSKNTGCFV